MNNVLIVYDTRSGSTKELALSVQKVIRAEGRTAVLSHFSEVTDMNNFETVIIGSPMRYGSFNKNILGFVRRFEQDLAKRRVYLFLSLMHFTDGGEGVVPGGHIFVDPGLAAAGESEGGGDVRHSLSYCMNSIHASAPSLTPKGIAFLGGRLDLSRIGFVERIVMGMRLSFKAMKKAGDLTNPAAAEEWAAAILRAEG